MPVKGLRKQIHISPTRLIEFNSVDWFDDDIIYEWDKDEIWVEDDNNPNEKIMSQYYNREHNLTYTIFNFGVTLEGESVCVRYEDNHPYFYIRIPSEFNNNQILAFKRAFTDFAIINIDNSVSKKDTNDMMKFNSPYYISSIITDECCEVEKEIFWKFTNHTKFKFYKLVFKSINAMKFYYRMLSKPISLGIPEHNQKPYKYNLFEADFEPILRFYHDQKIKPSGWIQIKPKTYKKVINQSTAQINISCHWRNAIPIEKDTLAPIRIAAFDIEADSSHGDFPIPRKDCKKLANQLVICWIRDNRILEKENKDSEKYINAQSRLKEEHKYFEKRLKQAVQIPKYKDIDDEIDILYQKGYDSLGYIERMNDKCSSYEFKELCKELFKICNRPLRKVKANNDMKSIIKKIIKAHEIYKEQHDGYINIDKYIEIIEYIGKKNIKKIYSLTDLVDKMFSKEILVKFVNDLLNDFFGVINGDRTIQIGTVFWDFGDDECFHNNIITLRGCDNFKVGSLDCEVIPFEYGSDLDADLAEAQLLLRWQKLIQDYDPDIITGYNIHGFDMLFMYERALELLAKTNKREITQQDLWIFEKIEKFRKFITLGRFTDEMIKILRKAKPQLVTKKLSSSALGDNILYYFNTPGRVQIDLLKVCQNSMDKLPSYKLDDVASYYISGKIKSLYGVDEYSNASESTQVKLCNKKGNINEMDDNNFIVIKMETTGQELYDGAKIKVLDIDRDNHILTLDKPIPKDCLVSLPKWGLAKDDVSPKDIFRLQRGNDTDRMIVAKYCIQDCVLLIRLMKKLEVITNNIGMSNVSLIPLAYIFLRGQGIKIFSLIVNECSENGFLLPTLEKIYLEEEELDISSALSLDKQISKTPINNKDDKTNLDISQLDEDNNDIFKLSNDFNVIKMTEDSYEGAIVLTPKPGIYFEPITVLDFSSLYPSEMIASNLSHDTMVEDDIWLGDEGTKRLKLLGYNILDRTYDNYKWIDVNKKSKGKIKDGITTIRFVQPVDGSKGLIPKVLMKLLSQRKAVKKLMNAEKDPFRASLLEGLQLAYKLTANSLYGQIGARTSKVFKKEIAACTTAGGRENIYIAKDYCLKNNPGCDVVYGDSIPDYENITIYFNSWDNKNYGKDNFDDIKLSISEFIYTWCRYYEDAYGKVYYEPITDVFTNTEKGYTKIIRVMEHYTKNHIYKVSTKYSSVCVTSDHSMLLSNGNPIKPTELQIGNKLLLTNYGYQNDSGIVVNIEDLGPYEGFVYDLTTDNHHFQAGNGEIIIHNTDSVFVKFNLDYNLEPRADECTELFKRFNAPYKPPNREGILSIGKSYPETKLDKITRSMEIGFWIQEKLKKDKIYTPPHDLEYEKVYYPLILITKKRYIGIKYEFDPDEGKKTSMGVVTKRRDNAPILKHTFIGVVDTLMKEMDLYKAINFVQDTCKQMIDSLFDLNMFVISKTLREYYKDPESIAHKVLADRMAERDPGNKPASNERIPYIYIKIDEKPGVEYLQGDRIEHVNFVRENRCQVDFEVYIKNQIMKPVSQIFELVLEFLPGYKLGMNKEYWSHIENKYYYKFDGDLKKTYKKVSEEKQKMVHSLIFDDVIHYARKKIEGFKTIEDFFIVNKKKEKKKELNQEEIFKQKKNTTVARKKQQSITSFFGNK
jgi:DNA polymerase elongation subunit (family B)